MLFYYRALRYIPSVPGVYPWSVLYPGSYRMSKYVSVHTLSTLAVESKAKKYNGPTYLLTVPSLHRIHSLAEFLNLPWDGARASTSAMPIHTFFLYVPTIFLFYLLNFQPFRGQNFKLEWSLLALMKVAHHQRIRACFYFVSLGC